MKTLKVLLQEVVSGIKAWVNSNFAQESNTVHKTGNETVNGVKTFTSTSIYNDVSPYCKNTSISGKLTPEVTSSIHTVTVGNSNMWYGNQLYILDANGECYWRWNAGSFLGTTQAQGVWGLDFGVKRDFSAVFLRPQFNNSYWLGESDHQWWAVYAKNYFYNGTAWGLDKANEWTQMNYFTKHLIINSEIATNTQSALSGSKIRQIIFNDSSNSNYFFRLRQYVDATSSRMQFNAQGFDSNNQAYGATFVYRTNSNGNTELYPGENNQSLGTTNNKWKTFNGINPGALSLPDFSADYDVSGEIVPPTGENKININGGENSFTPTVNGWLSIRMHYATSISIYRSTRSSHCFRTTIPSVDDICACSPVIAGVTYKIRIRASKWDDSGNNYDHFRLAPCQGNV